MARNKWESWMLDWKKGQPKEWLLHPEDSELLSQSHNPLRLFRKKVMVACKSFEEYLNFYVPVYLLTSMPSAKLFTWSIGIPQILQCHHMNIKYKINIETYLYSKKRNLAVIFVYEVLSCKRSSFLMHVRTQKYNYMPEEKHNGTSSKLCPQR